MNTSKSSRRLQLGRRPLVAALAAGAVAAGGLIAAGTGWAGPAPAAKDVAAAPARVAGQWQSTTVPVAKGDITAVAALSDKQAWSVGYRLKSDTELETLALHWDGTSWTQQSTLPKAPSRRRSPYGRPVTSGRSVRRRSTGTAPPGPRATSTVTPRAG